MIDHIPADERVVKLLDHGFVRLVDAMGNDLHVVRAARVSYEAAWRAGEDEGSDHRLIRYLWRHHHTSPFEDVELLFEVMAPIFVFRQWHRHRTQCLSGGTAINLVTPNGTTYKRTIRDLFQLKHGGVIDRMPKRTRNGISATGKQLWRDARYKSETRTRVLPNCQNRILRTLDEETGTYRTGSMRDVWESGVKEVWEVVTDSGTVRGSSEHPFLTREGWAKAKDLRPGMLLAASGRVATDDRPYPPSLRQGVGVWTSMMRKRLILPEDSCYLCGERFLFDDLELDHVVPVSENLSRALDETNLKPACVKCHRVKTDNEQPDRRGKSQLGLRWSRLVSIPERVSEEMTYDLEMAGPDHNYVANGLVVHNSYNELSGRYRELPEMFYVPDHGDVGIQAKNNKQGRDLFSQSDELLPKRMREVEAQRRHQEDGFKLYHDLIGSEWPKELARTHLGVATYSHMFAKMNLLNFFRFASLRDDPHAQMEIRVYAEAMVGLVRKVAPVCVEAWDEHRKWMAEVIAFWMEHHPDQAARWK